MTTELRIADIRADGGTQMRAQHDLTTIAEYIDAMERGDVFPPVVVFYDGTDYWLSEGFHRLEAHKNQERETISVDLREGTREDAVIWACAANAKHGLRRTNDDKRRAVETMLVLCTDWSDRKIAQHCAVTHPTVSAARARLEAIGKINQSPYGSKPAIRPLADVWPELRTLLPAEQFARVSAWDAELMRLKAEYEAADGGYLKLIRDHLKAKGRYDLWSQYLQACGLTDETAQTRIAAAEKRRS